MTRTKRIEIVFPVHNRREITLQCLRSLARIESENLEIHVIMVDDGSTDGTGESVEKEFPETEIIKGDGNLWFTEGTNVGVRAALAHNPDYVLMMNDDQVFDSMFLKYMVETAEKFPRSVVGSLLLLWDQPHKLFQVSPKWDTFNGGWQHLEQQTIWTIPKKVWEVEIIVGNCVLVPAKAIREEGLMNSERYPNLGDAEYTPRLRKKGWKLLIEPRARVFCQPNTPPPKFSEMSWSKKLDALLFNLGHHHNLRRRFSMHIDCAPSKFQGFTSFFIFWTRIFIQRVSRKPPNNSEKNIAEIFKDAVAED